MADRDEKELARLVREMRDAQREYFRTKDRAVLIKSKEIEKRVDQKVAEILKE